MYNDLIFKNLIDLSNYNGIETPARGKLVTGSNRVYDIVRKFKSKYGEGEVKKYYMKFDVAAEVPL